MEVTIIMAVVLVGAMYFFMIRPNKKQQQKHQQMMDSLEPGAKIMTSSGIYGTIRHLGTKQAIIEISPGADMTILRAAIRTVVSPEDDEFEYSDEEPASEVELLGDPEFTSLAESSSDLPDDSSFAFGPDPQPTEPATSDDQDK